MSLTQDAEADRRWDAAQKIADGEMDERMPRRRRIVWLWISALIVGSWILGLVLGMALPAPGISSGIEEEGWSARVIAGFVFQGVAIVVGIAGFIWARRTHRYITRWRAVASPLSMRERKWVLKQIRSGTPVDDDRKKTVVLAVASQNRRATLGVLPLYFCMTLLALGIGLSTPWAAIAWLELVAVLAFIGVFALLARDYRRAGVYLEKFGGHPPVTGSAAAAS